MGKKKNKAYGYGCIIGAVLLMIMSGPLAPLIAFGFGIAALIYVVRRISAVGKTAGPIITMPNYIGPGQQFQIAQFATEIRSLQKKMSRSARWQTDVDRIREASTLNARITHTANEAGIPAAAVLPLLASLTQSIKDIAANCIPSINRHYIEQTEKLQAISSPTRVAKAGRILLDQLAEIAATDPVFCNIAETLARPIRGLATSAEHLNTMKSRITLAQAAERAGKRDQALSDYLGLLYELKTDNITDEEQANEIADLEDRVRRVVRSYANLPRRRKTK